MATNHEIYRTAHLLISQYGADAPFHAAMNADHMLKARDTVGRGLWLKILAAVEELLDERPPPPGTSIH